MKLYFSTGTCSMACVAAVKELDLACELIEVSWNRDLNVEELNSVNPLGAVPVLVRDDGSVLTQTAAILSYMAETAARPGSGADAWSRAQGVRWLSFVGADFHMSFGPAFRAEEMAKGEDAQREITEFARANVLRYATYVDSILGQTPFIGGKEFTVADCYLYTALRWCDWIEVSLAGFNGIQDYLGRMSKRLGVAAAFALED